MKRFLRNNTCWSYFILACLTSLSDWIVASTGESSVPSGCTVITVSRGDKVFFGGNDDYINPDSYYWVDPGNSARYGVIWIGTPDNVQQGINEKGLAYDANGLPRVDVNPHNERILVEGGYTSYPVQIMHQCATVQEVVDWTIAHRWHSWMHDQMHFADATGDAVIISAGKDGELVFTRKQPGDGFLVSTNFNVANPSNSYNYPCWRYDKANELLDKLMKKESRLSARDLSGIMDSLHVEGASWTLETMVADLVNGVVYLYYFYQFDNPVVLNVKEELASPRQAGPLSNLFPEQVRVEAAKRYNQLTTIQRRNYAVGLSWTVLITLSLILLLIFPGNKKGLRFWVPAAIVLGPVALLPRFLTRNPHKASVWRDALIETTGNLVPVAFAYLIAEVVLVLKAVSGGISQQSQGIIILCLPLFAAWIIFHSPLLSLTGKLNFGRFLFKRLPQVLVTTFLGLAGIVPVTLPLMNKTIAMSQILPLSPWIVMTWLAIIATGCAAGGLIIYSYEYWAVKRGFRAWTIFAGNEGEVTTPGFSKLWWWIFISILILFAGFIAGVAINKIAS